MIAFLQTATLPHSGPSWQGIGTAAMALLQLVLVMWAVSINNDRRELRSKLELMSAELMRLATHIGIGGSSGVLAAIEEMKDEVKGLRADVHSAMEELAEQRGRNQHKGN